MKINLDIGNFIRRNLPIHMIQPNRLDLYWLIMREIDAIWNNYKAFRDVKDIERNITFSKKSLEWWLNRQLFGDGNANKIEIIFGAGNPYYMELGSRSTEPNAYVELSTDSGSNSVELSRREDDFGSISTDFAIQSTENLTDAQKEQINLIIEQFRIAGVNYEIIIS